MGGVPRGSFLIMVPKDFEGVTPHFSLLKVRDVSPTPLTMQVQQTYFELHKKSMPELDVWTQNELQWGALGCELLGTFYPNPEDKSDIEFAGDVNNVVSAHNYEVYAPNDALLNVIVNGIVPKEKCYELGSLRPLECRLEADLQEVDDKIPVNISFKDFKGTRTAMFGKTRLGKSNVVKLLAQGMIETDTDHQVGQLIFDINGEYANDNPQDGGKSLRSANEERTVVYALTKRTETPSNELRINFYQYPDAGMRILAAFLESDEKNSNYIKAFISSASAVINLEELVSLNRSEKTRSYRKILFYWAILEQAGFRLNEGELLSYLNSIGIRNFNPAFNKETREKIYDSKTLPSIKGITDVKKELKKLVEYERDKNTEELLSSSGKPLLDSDDLALLEFLYPKSGSGPTIIQPYRKFHSENASDFANEIISYLDQGKTVILDLGNAQDGIRRFFSDLLSKAVFSAQERKFVDNKIENKYVQLYFEEAHNLFPYNATDNADVYSRFAKEGAKFHIGMIYSTQSPSTISKELLAQTENFFVGHLSSSDEVKALAKMQVAFEGVGQDIMRAKTPGYMRVLTMSNRFVIPMQAKLFKDLMEGV